MQNWHVQSVGVSVWYQIFLGALEIGAGILMFFRATTALGIKKDSRKVGYALTTVKGDDLNIAKETNVATSLTGRVAGLSVNGNSGGPGSSARILLRGVTSFGASSPLFVINGVPMDNTQRGQSSEWGGADYGDGISNINPDDIETMVSLRQN